MGAVDGALWTRLADAVAGGRLGVVYQPQVDVHTGRPTGAEALVRFHDTRLGPIAPSEFIPVAEGNGLIDAISDHVLATALRDRASWARGHDITVSVNVSAHNLFASKTSARATRRRRACASCPSTR